MPTIIRENGFRLFFYADEGKEPPHVHVQYQGATAKFWVNPITPASNLGMNASQFASARILVQKYETLILESWNEFFGRKI